MVHDEILYIKLDFLLFLPHEQKQNNQNKIKRDNGILCCIFSIKTEY